MDIKPNPFIEQLTHCITDISSLEKRLIAEKSLKNKILISMENFYTDELKGMYFKQKCGKQLGQISHVFAKNNKLFVRLYFWEITSNSKLVKKYSNIELLDGVMNNYILLSESEYKEAFFDYINSEIDSGENV